MATVEIVRYSGLRAVLDLPAPPVPPEPPIPPTPIPSAPWPLPVRGLLVSLGGHPLATFGLLPEDGEATGEQLVRAAWLSLICRRVADPSDELPDPWGDPPDRGGWWGDADAPVPGDHFGSRLWLLYRARGEDVPLRAEEYVREALEWMREDGLASAVECTATAVGDRLDLDVRIYRPSRGQGTPVRLQWNLWEGL